MEGGGEFLRREGERINDKSDNNGSTSDIKGQNRKNKLAFIAFLCFTVAY